MSSFESPKLPNAAIACDLACLHCGYNLVGRRLDERCSECGRPVADALDTLALWSMTRLAKARMGVLVCVLASVFGVIPMSIAVGGMALGGRVQGGLILMIAVFAVSGPVVAAFGHYLFTTTEGAPYFEGRPLPIRGVRGRILARSLGALYPVSALMAVFLPFIFEALGARVTDATLNVGISAMGVAWMSRNWASCRYLGDLARRGGSEKLSGHFRLLSMVAGTMAIILIGLELVAQARVLSLIHFALGAWCVGAFAWMVVWPIALMLLKRRIDRAFRVVRASSGTVLVPTVGSAVARG